MLAGSISAKSMAKLIPAAGRVVARDDSGGTEELKCAGYVDHCMRKRHERRHHGCEVVVAGNHGDAWWCEVRSRSGHEHDRQAVRGTGLSGLEPSDPQRAEQAKSQRGDDEKHEGTEHGVLRGE